MVDFSKNAPPKIKLLIRGDNAIDLNQRLNIFNSLKSLLKTVSELANPFKARISCLRRAEIIKTVVKLMAPFSSGDVDTSKLKKPVLFVIKGKGGGGKSFIADIIYDVLKANTNPYWNITSNEDGSKKDKMQLEENPMQAAFNTVKGGIQKKKDLFFSSKGTNGIAELFQAFPDFQPGDVLIVSEDAECLFDFNSKVREFFNVVTINISNLLETQLEADRCKQRCMVNLTIDVQGEELQTSEMAEAIQSINQAQQTRLDRIAKIPAQPSIAG